MIHTVKGFSILNEAEVDVFLELSCFFYDPTDVGNLISGPSAFSPDWTPASSRFMYCWSLAWRILSITVLACEMSAIVWYFEHSLALPFLGIGMKTDLSQSCGHCWVFQIACITYSKCLCYIFIYIYIYVCMYFFGHKKIKLQARDRSWVRSSEPSA